MTLTRWGGWLLFELLQRLLIAAWIKLVFGEALFGTPIHDAIVEVVTPKVGIA